MQENNNELKHFGILGMKWGHRKTTARLVAQKKRISDSAKKKMNKAYEKGTLEDYKNAKKVYNQANKDYKREIKKTNESYTPNYVDKHIFGGGTTKLINKYLNKGDSIKSARTKAYAVAGANTAAIVLGVIGAKIITDKIKRSNGSSVGNKTFDELITTR